MRASGSGGGEGARGRKDGGPQGSLGNICTTYFITDGFWGMWGLRLFLGAYAAVGRATAHSRKGKPSQKLPVPLAPARIAIGGPALIRCKKLTRGSEHFLV